MGYRVSTRNDLRVERLGCGSIILLMYLYLKSILHFNESP
jgi:hypothetical protein